MYFTKGLNLLRWEILALVGVGLCANVVAEIAPSELRKGDRVALVGNTFIEREADQGYIETALTLSHPDANLVFRNFGWSGDTVTGASRGYFKPEAGYGLLLKDVAESKPTVIVLGYGANAAWDGEKGLAGFGAGLKKLMDDLKKQTGARFVLLSPLAQEAIPEPYPNPTAHNADLARYTALIKSIAAERNAGFIDLFNELRAPAGKQITSNSIHLSPAGYQEAAAVMTRGFGKSVVSLAKAEPLRQRIRAKNEQHFNQWRPQNITYLTLFRKHEQGNNAVEMEQIKPIVAKMDAEIHQITADVVAGRTPAVKTVIKKGAGFKPSEGKYVREPETTRKTLTLADGLEVSLFAAEPMVVNPTNMSWDGQGRLWVASAPLYPHVKPGHRATDRILILEDTDKDGKADKSTVFADGLLIPTMVLPGDGGCYVGNSTEVIHLKDTDGDGKADTKRIVMSGFGTEDTHHILHTPRWGQDGLLYFNQSIYIHSHVETPWGVERLMAGGIWQFEPKTGRMTVVSRGLINTWGHQMDDWGQSFASDGAGGEGMNYIFPGVAARTAYGTRHILPGMNPGQPKLCGLEMISGTHLPKQYHGMFVANDFRGHRTSSYRLTDNGSGYVSKQGVDFINTGHKGADRLGTGGSFRPIDLKMGPDGALYIADWSNIIIQHGEVDFRDDRRDHEHGRIWRISATGKDPLTPPPIVGAPVDQLIKNLSSPERWVVEKTKRELIERGTGVLTAVKSWEANLSGPDADRLRLQALWLHVGLNEVNVQVLTKCLTSKDGRVRAAAMRVVFQWFDRIEQVEKLLEVAVRDKHPRVRLETLPALRKLQTPRAAELAAQLLDQEMDKVLDYALTYTLRELQPHWVGKASFGGNVKHIAYAVKATGTTAPLASLFAGLNAGTIPDASKEDVLMLIAELGDRKQIGSLFGLVVQGGLSDGAKAKILNSMTNAVTKRKVRPAGNLAPLAELVASDKAEVSIAASKLAGQARVGAALGALRDTALKTSGRQSTTAIQAIGTIGGGGAVQMLKQIAETGKAAQQIAAVASLVGPDRNQAATLAVKLFGSLPAQADPSSIFDTFYRIPDGPAVLGKALGDAKIPAHVAEAGIRRATTSGRDLAAHIRALSTAGGLKPMKQQLSAAEMAALVQQVNKSGNPVAGEQIYRRPGLACMTCHAIGGAGSKTGPDLISIGASAPVDYIIESLLNPNAKIKEGYHMTVATLKDGRMIAGTQVSDADGQVVMRDTGGTVHTLAKNQIKSKVINPTSMMPPGLTASLQPLEFVHLSSFLSKLGKDPRYTVPKRQFVRSFSVAVVTDKLNKGVKEKSVGYVSSNLGDVQWRPGNGLVNGKIPLGDGSVFTGGHRFLRFSVDVTKAGAFSLHIPKLDNVAVWQNGKKVKFTRGGRGRIEAKKGTVEIVAFIGAKHSSPMFSVELIEIKDGAVASLVNK